MDEYMNEVYMYGGLPMRRADIIRDLQRLGDQRLISAYLMGMSQKEPLRGVEPYTLADLMGVT